MSNFFEKPSPSYHYAIMLPVYYTFAFILDEYIMRRHASVGIILASLSTILVFINYIIGAYPSGSVGLFLMIKAFSLIIPAIWINSYRVWGTPNRCIKLPALEPDAIDDQAQNWRETCSKIGCNCVNNHCTKLCSNTKCDSITRIFFYVFLLINIFEALLFESIPGAAESNDGVWEWAKYINIIAGIICVVTIPLPKENTWYLDENRDYIMYLPNEQKYYYFGILWIILYTIWNFGFLIRLGGSDAVLFIPIHLIIPFFKAIHNHQFGLWLQTRLYVLWAYVIFIFILRDKIFNSTNIDPNFIGDGVTLGIFAIIASITGILYLVMYYCKYKPEKTSLSLSADMMTVDIINMNNNTKVSMKSASNVMNQNHPTVLSGTNNQNDKTEEQQEDIDTEMNDSKDDENDHEPELDDEIIRENEMEYKALEDDSVYLYVSNKNYIVGQKLPLHIQPGGSLKTKPYYPLEMRPTFINRCYFSIETFLGFLTLLCSLFGVILPMMFVGWLTTIFCFCFFKPANTSKKYYEPRKYFHKQSGLEKLCYTCSFCKRNRKFCGTIRLRLLATSHSARGIIWNVANHFTGMLLV